MFICNTALPYTNQLESSIGEFRTAQDNLAEVRERYKNGSSSVNELARELAQVRTNTQYI